MNIEAQDLINILQEDYKTMHARAVMAEARLSAALEKIKEYEQTEEGGD